MSGGGGGGDYIPTPPAGPCQQLAITTAVQSPDPEVVQSVTRDAVLEVHLEPQGDRSTVFVYLESRRLGTLIFPGLPRLIECLEQGYEYVADVTAVEGPDCRVRVRPR